MLTNALLSYPILDLASLFWYYWMCNIQEGTIHMLTYSYTESNQPQKIKIRATPTFLVCLSPRVKCTQHLICGRSLTFMLCTSGVGIYIYFTYSSSLLPRYTGMDPFSQISYASRQMNTLGVRASINNTRVVS